MKYGGTVGAGIKRLFLPESLKEKLVPTHVDPNIPYEHLMKVKWNIGVIKYGLLHWYSDRYHDKSFQFGQLRSKNSKTLIPPSLVMIHNPGSSESYNRKTFEHDFEVQFELFESYYRTKFRTHFSYLDYCEEATLDILKNINDETICKSPFNMLIKPIKAKAPDLKKLKL